MKILFKGGPIKLLGKCEECASIVESNTAEAAKSCSEGYNIYCPVCDNSRTIISMYKQDSIFGIELLKKANEKKL